MKKISKIVYIIRMLLFVFSFYFIFIMLENILDTGIYGIIFLIFYFLLVMKIIIELLSKKDQCKDDFIYNVMQISLYTYLTVISLKTAISNAHVTRLTFSYFRLNYVILSILILFIFVYSSLEKKDDVKQQ